MLSGCTTAADHHYLFPKGLENAVDIEVEAARETRHADDRHARLDEPAQKDGGLPPDSVVQDEDEILADSERVLKLFHDPKPGADIRIALAPCSPFSIDKRLMSESADARGTIRLPAPHPSLRDRGRGALLPGNLRRAARRSARGDRLDVEAHLARARHPLQ